MLSFIETPLFTRLVYVCLSGEEYAALQAHLARDSESGEVVPGSGGVRKLRRGAAGRGKRGGVRVIYFVRAAKGIIWNIYAKNEAENIPAHVLRKIRQELSDDED